MPFDGPSGYRVALEQIARAWEPRRPLGTSAWSDRYRRLSGRSAKEPGRWQTSRIPFLRAIMDAMDWSHPAPVIVFVGSSQIAKSECMLNKIGQIMHQDPAPILVLFPNEKQGGDWRVVRLDPMLDETPELRAIIPTGRRMAAGNTQKRLTFPGGVLFTGSSGVAADLAQKSVRYVMIDELDRWPELLEGEGDPVELAMTRTAAFEPRCKTYISSTPTTDETSLVWPWWLKSTMDRYHMPCPNCSHMQHLQFENLSWITNRPSTAVYECEECAKAIGEHCKTEMLRDGEWRAEHPERESMVKGFHANGLMTPIGLGRSWANHAAAWDRAHGSPGKIQVFYNTRRGEVVKSEKIKLDWEMVAGRREPYALRTIPPGVLLLTAFADVQGNRIEAGIIGWGRGERATVVDDVVFYGDPTREEIWRQLDGYFAGEIINSFGVPMRIAAAGVDSGAWQQEVLAFTRPRRARGIFATKGSSVRSRAPIGKPTFLDINWRGLQLKRGVEQYQLGVSVLKQTLYRRLQADAGEPNAPVPIGDRHIRFSTDLPDEYFRQLTAERFDEREGWKKVYDHNEKLDIFVGCMAMSMHHTIGIHRYRELDWQRLEQLYEPQDGAVPAKPATPAQPTMTRHGFPIVGATVRN